MVQNMLPLRVSTVERVSFPYSGQRGITTSIHAVQPMAANFLNFFQSQGVITAHSLHFRLLHQHNHLPFASYRSTTKVSLRWSSSLWLPGISHPLCFVPSQVVHSLVQLSVFSLLTCSAWNLQEGPIPPSLCWTASVCTGTTSKFFTCSSGLVSLLLGPLLLGVGIQRKGTCRHCCRGSADILEPCANSSFALINCCDR